MSVKIYNALRTERKGNQLWQLLDDFKVKVDGVVIIVPKGFITNGASVPNAFWWLCPPIAGSFGEAAVVHDYMYFKGSKWSDREQADKFLYKIGRALGANWLQAQLVYRAVRMFGGNYWKQDTLGNQDHVICQ